MVLEIFQNENAITKNLIPQRSMEIYKPAKKNLAPGYEKKNFENVAQ